MPLNTRRHIIVDKEEWKTIINALDVLEAIVQDQPIDEMLLKDLKFFFKPDKIAMLSGRICLIK